MNQITTMGNLPIPIARMGLLDESMERKLELVRREVAAVDINAGNILAVPPEVWECTSLAELGQAASMEECEHQVLVDKERGRYYLCAFSADPDRVRTKAEETEFGNDIVEDEGPRSPMVLYFIEITRAQFRYWQGADMDRRKTWIAGQMEE